jgi:hypothetical protein
MENGAKPRDLEDRTFQFGVAEDNQQHRRRHNTLIIHKLKTEKEKGVCK